MRGFRLHLLYSIIAALTAALFFAQPSAAGTTGVIKGVVVDAQGHPLAGVHVSVVSPTYNGSTTTGNDGFYVVTGLPVDTYLITFSKTGYEVKSVPGVTVVQDQNVRLDAAMQTAVKSLGVIPVRGVTSLVQPTVTADTYTVSQTTLQNLNGTPQDLNGFQAFNSLPGVTTDNFGYPIIRAGAENDVGYAYEGIDNTDPISGQFLNGLSLNGTRSIELSTGGYDVSNGNTNSGIINQVIQRGAYPGSGQSTIRFFSPAYGHELSIDYGNATPDNRFSYYLSFGGQRDATIYGDGHTVYPLLVASSDFTTTDDSVGNFYYHFGKNNANELQFLADATAGYFGFGTQVNPFQSPYAPNNGNVQAGSVISGTMPPVFTSDFITLYPGEVSYRQNINYVDTQTFNSLIEKVNFKHQFTSSSFGNVRLYRVLENLIFRYPYDVGSFSDFYEDLNTSGTGVGIDYTNQVSSRHELGFGGDYTFYKNTYQAGYPSLEPTFEPLEGTGCAALTGAAGTGGCYIAGLNAQLNASLSPSPGLPTDPVFAPMSTYANDFSNTNDPLQRMNFFVKDLYQPNDRLTLDLGLRFDKEDVHLPGNIPQANEFYIIDDAGNYVTKLGDSIGRDVTQPSQISPRLAVSYKLGARDVVRMSFGKNIEFEPLNGIENTYVVDPALKNCTIASGCFQPLQGYSPTCVNGVDPANSGAPCNDVNNLFQQIIVDQNTNNFAQYTPVRPQRAINADFSIEHDFGNGLQLKISPYYRKGTDYVIGTSNLLFTLPSGKPVFGPTREINAGANKNTGVEFEIQKQAQYGFSGLFDATYDNTFANYSTSQDFFPTVNAAALAAGHFFHVTYVAPITATFNVNYNSRPGLHVSVTVPYESGYRYGVGKKVFIFEPNGAGGTNIPVQVLNTDIANSNPADAYYFTDPSSPGTPDHPNIIGSRGTPEGDDPGTIHGPQVATLNVSVSQDFGAPRNMTIGVRVLNLLGNYTPVRIVNNPYYLNNGFGTYAPTSGSNPNIGIEPYQYNYSPFPYENEPTGPPRLWTVFVSMKY